MSPTRPVCQCLRPGTGRGAGRTQHPYGLTGSRHLRVTLQSQGSQWGRGRRGRGRGGPMLVPRPVCCALIPGAGQPCITEGQVTRMVSQRPSHNQAFDLRQTCQTGNGPRLSGATCHVVTTKQLSELRPHRDTPPPIGARDAAVPGVRAHVLHGETGPRRRFRSPPSARPAPPCPSRAAPCPQPSTFLCRGPRYPELPGG